MATKDEIIDGMRGVEERLERLLPRAKTQLDRPLTEGTWSVHDALCHMAADANAYPRWASRLAAIESGTQTPRPPGFNLDALNQQNIDARKHKPLDEVVAEIKGGLAADTDAVRAVDDGILTKEIPNFRGEMTTAGAMLLWTTTGHNHVHLDDIEKALT
jgi:Mycothiol maleylpyruvate isomerase N-terminal domain